MAKKKEVKEQTLKEKLLEIIRNNNAIFRSRWKEAWATYKTVIGPFFKGTATYLWALIYGSAYYVGNIFYNCIKVLLKYLFSLIKRS